MSRFLLLTVLLSAVLSSNYLKLTYQDKIVRCAITTVRRGCVLNLYINDKDNLVAFSSTGMSVQYEWRSISISRFICDAKCGHGSQSYTLGAVDLTVNEAVFIGLVLGGVSFPFLTFCVVRVWWKRRKRRRDARNIYIVPAPTARDRARYPSNTPTVDFLRGPRHEVRTSQHTGPAVCIIEELGTIPVHAPPTAPAVYRLEELPRLPTTFPVHAAPTAPNEELILAPVPALHIAPVEALPSYEQALELEKAADI